MTVRDILLALASYPEPTPDASIDKALAFASLLNAQVTGLAFETELRLMRPSDLLTRVLVDVPAMAAEESARSKAHAARLMSCFEASATSQRVRHEARVEHCDAFGVAAALVEESKVHDLTVLPLQDAIGIEQWHAESVIFGSGRPVLLLPGPAHIRRSPSLDRITLAWDFSRPAARALADALPLMRQAGRVQIVMVENEKELPARRTPERLLEHLMINGVAGKFEVVDAAGRRASELLRDYLDTTDATMLVMGAFGHSRLREFVMGGTTRSMLDDPPLPVFLSH
ncbi:MAG: universal stress protein [Alphaproteobacteria bacterium]|nr:universal stress protein [Alphaproteobacteria bacterium]MBL6936985.1 universal stress protein [Alphaproteobacteria bacterium]MBL7097754.1 universal stress protein [Alphaproteobacteria bacterium]